MMIETLRVSPARENDPTTAHLAALVNGDIRGEQRRLVYQYLADCGNKGATDYEISQALGILRTSAGKRRKELQENCYVVPTAERRKTDTNSTAIVWSILSPRKVGDANSL